MVIRYWCPAKSENAKDQSDHASLGRRFEYGHNCLLQSDKDAVALVRVRYPNWIPKFTAFDRREILHAHKATDYYVSHASNTKNHCHLQSGSEVKNTDDFRQCVVHWHKVYDGTKDEDESRHVLCNDMATRQLCTVLALERWVQTTEWLHPTDCHESLQWHKKHISQLHGRIVTAMNTAGLKYTNLLTCTNNLHENLGRYRKTMRDASWKYFCIFEKYSQEDALRLSQSAGCRLVPQWRAHPNLELTWLKYNDESASVERQASIRDPLHFWTLKDLPADLLKVLNGPKYDETTLIVVEWILLQVKHQFIEVYRNLWAYASKVANDRHLAGWIQIHETWLKWVKYQESDLYRSILNSYKVLQDHAEIHSAELNKVEEYLSKLNHHAYRQALPSRGTHCECVSDPKGRVYCTECKSVAMSLLDLPKSIRPEEATGGKYATAPPSVMSPPPVSPFTPPQSPGERPPVSPITPCLSEGHVD